MRLFRPAYESETDEQLMQRVSRGDSRAFEIIYDRHSKALFRYFLRMLWKDKEKAEDFVQDFFMKIIKSPDAFDTKRKFSTWMYSVAHNMCKNEYRSMEVRKPANFEHAAGQLVSEDGDHFGHRIDRKAFMRQLFDELGQLDENHRSTFLLRYEENLSIKEISEALNCSEGTVKSRLFYTLRKLAAKLSAYAPNEKTSSR